MKRKILFIIAILGFSLRAFAQEERGEKKFAVGLGLEWNMNARENFAGGAVLGFDYNLPIAAVPFAVGLTVSYSNNFVNFSVIETSAMFRWYFIGNRHTGFFAQADVGAFLTFEDEQFIPLFMGGLRAGYRFLLGSIFYVEPFGRVGYPFMFGIGATAGLIF